MIQSVNPHERFTGVYIIGLPDGAVSGAGLSGGGAVASGCAAFGGGPSGGGVSGAAAGVEGLPERLELQEGAGADITLVVMPGADCDIHLDIDLLGRHSECSIQGVYLCPDNESVRIAVDLKHSVPECSSRQLFKGIAGGRAHVDFYGKIIVAPDAQKTEAYQENHNLLLSDTAKVNTKPQLEIYADDVKCSHGATIGRLNEDEQFYMRSRGIPLSEARVLQMVSFLSPVFGHIQDAAERDRLLAAVETAVRQM